MKALYIADKNLKDFFRNMKSNAIVFVLPYVFLSIFAFAFGKSFSNMEFEVAIVKNDNAQYIEFTNTLRSLEKENSKTGKMEKVFALSEFETEEDAVESVKDNKNLAVIMWDNQNNKLITKFDQTNSFATAVVGVVKDITNPNNEFVKTEPIISNDFTGFQQIAPGLIIYGLLILLPQVAGSLAKLRQSNQIFRYFTSKTNSFDIIIGYLISQTVLALIQTAILFATAMMYGVDFKGSIISAIVIAILTNLFVVGLGLILGAFAEKEDSASSLGTLFSIIIGFLSGSFISGIEEQTINIFGKSIVFSKFIPTSHATAAMKDVMLYGRNFSNIQNELIILGLSSIVILVLGIVLYQLRQLKRIS